MPIPLKLHSKKVQIALPPCDLAYRAMQLAVVSILSRINEARAAKRVRIVKSPALPRLRVLIFLFVEESDAHDQQIYHARQWRAVILQ